MDQLESKPQQRRVTPRRKPKGGTKIVCRKGAMGLGPNVGLSLGDISEWGVRLVVGAPLKRGEEVEVVLSGPGITRDIVRLGEVIWSLVGEDGSCRVGVRFHKRLDHAQLQD